MNLPRNAASSNKALKYVQAYIVGRILCDMNIVFVTTMGKMIVTVTF